MDPRITAAWDQLRAAARDTLLEQSKDMRDSLIAEFDGDNETEQVIRHLVEADFQFSQMVASLKTENVHPLGIILLGSQVEHNHDVMNLIGRINVEKLREDMADA